jgi:hypothetical protein
LKADAFKDQLRPEGHGEVGHGEEDGGWHRSLIALQKIHSRRDCRTEPAARPV